MSNDYDKIFRENALEVLMAFLRARGWLEDAQLQALPHELPQTPELKPDFLQKVVPRRGAPFILHIEFQSADSPDMGVRMQAYHAFLVKEYRMAVRQYVVFLGEGAARNVRRPVSPELRYRSYQLLHLRETPYEEFLASQAPGEVLLAVFGQFDPRDAAEVIRRIVSRLMEITQDPFALRKYLKQLAVLSQKRQLDQITQQIIDTMPIDIDYREHVWYRRGKDEGKLEGIQEGIQKGKAEGIQEGKAEGIQKGKAEGIQEGKAEAIRKMHRKGFSVVQIAEILEVPAEAVRATIKI